MIAIGLEGSLYAVGSGEVAIINPDDGSTVRSIPFPFVNGCNAAISRGVLWVYSDTQTYAHDSTTLALMRVFDGSAGFNLGFDPLGAFASGTAALNTCASDIKRLDVYRQR